MQQNIPKHTSDAFQEAKDQSFTQLDNKDQLLSKKTDRQTEFTNLLKQKIDSQDQNAGISDTDHQLILSEQGYQQKGEKISKEQSNFLINDDQNIFNQIKEESDYQFQSSNNTVNKQQRQSNIFMVNKTLKSQKLSTSTFQSKKSIILKKSTMISQTSSFNFQLIFQLKNRMIYFYNNFTAKGRNKLLQQNPAIRSAINDQSDFFFDKTTIFMLLITRCLNFCSKKNRLKGKSFSDLYTIVPNSNLNFFFLVFFSSMSILFFFLLSIILVYQGYHYYLTEIKMLIIISWLFEAFIQMNTSIYDSTNLINDRSQIIYAYLTKRASCDIIPILALIFLPETFVWHEAFIIVAFVKLKNVLSDINLMQRLLCMSVKKYYIVQMFNLIFKILVLGHIIACIWYLIGKMELHILNYETTWYDSSLGADYVWWKLYLESMYWSLTLMTTGSNTGSTIPQLMFTTFIMLFSTIIFGYLLNTTGIILSQVDESDEHKRVDLNIINDYMRANKISRSLQGRVNKDLEYYYLHNIKKEHEENQSVLNKISPHLQNLLKLEYCKLAISKMKFFTQKFSKEVMEEICLELQEVYFSPNQIVFEEEQADEISLIYIVKGQLEIQRSLNNNPKLRKFTQKLNVGDIAGQVNFFNGQPYTYSLKSSVYTKALTLQRSKFLEIIQKYPKDYEIYCYIKDQLQMQQEYSIISYKCNFCKSTTHQSTHQSTDCNLLSIERNDCIFKAKFLEKSVQIRKQKERIKKYKCNSLLIRQEIEEQIRKYAWEIKKLQKMEQYIQMHKHIQQQMDDSVDFSNDSIQISTAQILFTQNTSDDENEQSLDVAQHVKNEQYFNDNSNFRQKIMLKSKKNNITLQPDNSISEIQQDMLTTKIMNTSVRKQQQVPSLTTLDMRNLKSQKKINIGQDHEAKRILNIQNQITTPTRLFTNNRHKLSIIEKPLLSVIEQPRLSINERNQPIDEIQRVNRHQPTMLKSGARHNYERNVGQGEYKKQQTLIIQNNLLEDDHHKKKHLFHSEFDIAKEWSYYYPFGNKKIIIAKCNRYIKKRQKYAILQMNKK